MKKLMLIMLIILLLAFAGCAEDVPQARMTPDYEPGDLYDPELVIDGVLYSVMHDSNEGTTEVLSCDYDDGEVRSHGETERVNFYRRSSAAVDDTLYLVSIEGCGDAKEPCEVYLHTVTRDTLIERTTLFDDAAAAEVTMRESGGMLYVMRSTRSADGSLVSHIDRVDPETAGTTPLVTVMPDESGETYIDSFDVDEDGCICALLRSGDTLSLAHYDERGNETRRVNMTDTLAPIAENGSVELEFCREYLFASNSSYDAMLLASDGDAWTPLITADMSDMLCLAWSSGEPSAVVMYMLYDGFVMICNEEDGTLEYYDLGTPLLRGVFLDGDTLYCSYKDSYGDAPYMMKTFKLDDLPEPVYTKSLVGEQTEELYDGGARRIEMEIVEDEHGYFESIAFLSDDGYHYLEIAAKEDAPPIAIGSHIWEENHLRTPLDSEQGYVDRILGSLLMRVGTLRGKVTFTNDYGYPFVEQYTLNNPYNPEQSAVGIRCSAELHAGGEYQITVQFRMCEIEPLPERDPNDWRTPPQGKAIYTTGEELYSVVCRLVLPENVENPHFGLVEEVYTPFPVYEPAVTEGDTDLLNITSICRNDGIGVYGSVAFNCRTAGDRWFALTARQYTDGELVFDPGYEYPCGVVEKLIDGEWTPIGGIGSDVIWVMTDDPPPFDTVKGEETRQVEIPLYSPGEYRVTRYFRECISNTPGEYTTGAELYSVTTYLTVPDASGRRFDIAHLTFGEGYTENHGMVNFYLRANEGRLPYLDRLESTLEKKVGGEYVLIEQFDDESREMYSKREYRFYDGNSYLREWEHIDETAALYQHDFSFGELPDGEYRLTLEFCEGNGGGGQQWSVEIILDVGEQEGWR